MASPKKLHRVKGSAFYQRLNKWRRKIKVFKGRGFLQIVGRQGYIGFRMPFMARDKYERYRDDLGFERKHGSRLKDQIIRENKPYHYEVP